MLRKIQFRLKYKLLLLIIAESHQRVDLRRAARRQRAGCEGKQRQYRRRNHERRRIEGPIPNSTPRINRVNRSEVAAPIGTPIKVS